MCLPKSVVTGLFVVAAYFSGLNRSIALEASLKQSVGTFHFMNLLLN